MVLARPAWAVHGCRQPRFRQPQLWLRKAERVVSRAGVFELRKSAGNAMQVRLRLRPQLPDHRRKPPRAVRLRIESDLECGIMLQGSEVKSLRTGKANIAESYASVENGELWLINSYIAPYRAGQDLGP
jgi:hypothetical protein